MTLRFGIAEQVVDLILDQGTLFVEREEGRNHRD